jgi:hypothetical protein
MYIAMTALAVGASVENEDGTIKPLVTIPFRSDQSGNSIAWQPVPEYLNPNSDMLATSNDYTSWPDCWNNKFDDNEDPGWCGSWNGYFGKNYFIEGQEIYYRISDDRNFESGYTYYPDTTDYNRQGAGLLVDCRTLEWNLPDLEDVVFHIYTIKNDGTKNLDTMAAALWIADLVGGDGDSGDDIPGYDINNLDTLYTFEDFVDLGNGIWDEGEPYVDLNGNDIWDEEEEFTDLGNGIWDPAEEFDDLNGNGIWDDGDVWEDLNDDGLCGVDINYDGEYGDDLDGDGFCDGEICNDINDNGCDPEDQPYYILIDNGLCDCPEPYVDLNDNGSFEMPEPLDDLNGNGIWDDAEEYDDINGNGIWDSDTTIYENPIQLAWSMDGDGIGNIAFGGDPVGIPGFLFLKTPDDNGITSVGCEPAGGVPTNSSATMWNSLMNPGDFWDGNIIYEDTDLFIGTGYFSLEPGEEKEIIYATILSNDFNDMYSKIDVVKSFYENGFELNTDLSISFIEGANLVNNYTLHQNYPNPFNPITTLRYDLPSNALVTLSIYDMLGREITQLVNTTQQAGFKSVQWDATDMHGKPVSAGVYLYQIRAGEFVQTRKMVLLK